MHPKKALSLLVLSTALVTLVLTSCSSEVPETPKAPVVSKKTIPAIAAGDEHSMILKDDGTVWVAGSNGYGQLGLEDSKATKPFFTQATDKEGAKITNIQAIAAGYSHSFILKEDGTVLATGLNFKGQLGLGDNERRYAFTQLDPLGSGSSKVVAIAAGNTHSMILKDDGSVWATGLNDKGQLGLGDSVDKSTFTQVTSLGSSSSKVIAIAAGKSHSMILKEDGSVWATGANNKGQLGLKDNVDKSTFTQVEPLGASSSKGIAIVAGDSHSMILTEDGDVWMTGTGSYGLLGLGTTTSTTSFTQVKNDNTNESITQVQAIAAGNFHSIILKNKKILGTGSSSSGRLGIEGIPSPGYIYTFTYIEKDVSNTNIDTITAIAAGKYHSLILTEDGKVLSTGENHKGQLGIGNTTDVSFFTEVLYE